MSTVIDTTGHVPPHNMEAEAAIIAAVLLTQGMAATVSKLCTPHDMYSESHRRILEAAMAIHGEGLIPDVVTVGGKLSANDRLRQVGGMNYITTLLACYEGEFQTVQHCREVKRLAQQRRAIAVLARSAAEGYLPEGKDDPIGWLSRTRQSLEDIQLGGDASAFESADVFVARSVKSHAAYAASGRKMRGIPTGFIDLDRILNGWKPGHLIFVGARPGMGKTAFMGSCAVNAARAGIPIGIFSLEMLKEELGDRMVCSRAGIPTDAFDGELSAATIDRMGPAVKDVRSLPIHIDDRTRRLDDICSAAWAAKRDLGVKMIMIDYIQLIPYEKRDENESLTMISRRLVELAKDLKIPIMALAQLSRALENRPNKRPMQSDLRGSGSMEQDANEILFLYRDEKYDADSPDKGIAEIIVEKQRGGQTGVVKLAFNAPTTTFYNLLRAV